MREIFLQKIQQRLAKFLIFALATSMLMPIANAMPNDPQLTPAISNVSMTPVSPFNPNTNGYVVFKYTLAGLDSGQNANMTAKLIKGNQERILESASHPNGTYEIPWDAQFPDGMKPADGTDYYFQVSGIYGMAPGQPGSALAVKSIQFEVKAIDPAFSNVNVDTATYNLNTDNDGLKCSYTLSNLYGNATASVTVKILKNDGLNTLVKTFPTETKGNGTFSVVWDGKAESAAVGDYKCRIEGKWGAANTVIPMKEITFSVEKPLILLIPVLGQPTVSKNPYDYSNSNTVDFNYSYQNLSNNQISAAVYAKDGDNNAANDVEIYKFPNVMLDGTGSQKVTWNGKNSNASYVVDGDYYFKVWGTLNNNMVTKQVDFKVDTPDAPANAPSITNLKANPVTFAPDSNETTTISFELSQNAEVTILTSFAQQPGMPQLGSQIEVYKASKNAGTVNFIWNGKDGSTLYANGTWPLVVQAKNANGSDEEVINVTIVSKKNPNPTTCGGFTDVPQDLCPAFEFTKNKGIFLGDDNSTKVRPYDVINRVEAAAVILRSFDKTMFAASGNNEGFSDVDLSQSYMTSGTVRSAKHHGVLKGYPDGTLKPAQRVINAELLTMFGRASGKTFPQVQTKPFLDTPLDASSSWYIQYVNGAKLWGWISAGSYFYPTKGMTRGNVAKLIYDASQAGLSIPGAN